MEFRLLGPLEVVEGERKLALGGPKQRAVLAHLILRANAVVAIDLLIDAVWGDEPPAAARRTLQAYVSRLRRLIGEQRLEGRGGGYVLTCTPEEIDAARFDLLVKRGKDSIASDPVAAAEILSEALAMWRGSALADLAEEASLRGEITRLEDMRLSATEHLISAEIAAGKHSTIVGRLEVLTERYPMRERLWASLMLALYRLGRQGDALAAYQEVRRVLADELGIDPSSELQHLNRQILEQDPELRSPPTPVPASTVRTFDGDLEPGFEFAGYRIEAIIGRGGMGVVYLAEHEGLKRKVALKLLAPQLADDPRFRERFGRESQLAASIDHPNVIPIYEAGEAEGHLYIAMRYVEGTDLRSLLRDRGTLDAAEASGILRQIAAALDSAHEQGLVHRDVKPANVLIARRRGTEPGAHAYLTDFGLTKRTASDSGVTGGGQFVGSLDYAAPEQFRGEATDPRTDVYSLGCLLFECLAGHPPFRAENDAALMFTHLMEPPPRLTAERPDLSTDVDDVVAKAMAKEPEDRYPGAGAFASSAAAALGHPLDEPSIDHLTGSRSPPTAGTGTGGLMDVPEVRYAKTPAGVHVAYLVVGAGAVDLLWPGDSFSNLDALSDLPESARFLQKLGSIARLITFDPRGTGLSDRISEQQLPTLETRMADAVAVMDAAGSTRTALLGADATGPLAILFAATYPERTSALILYSTYASGRWSPDYPWGWTEDEWDASLKKTDEQWGEPAYSEELIEWLAPSALADPETINRFIRFFRSAASPSTAVAMERMERDTDIREVLPAVHVPTLVLHRTGSRIYQVGEARYLAEHISGARLVELDGVDHLAWFGETDPIVREIDRFLGSVLDEETELDRVLATVMFTDIVGSTQRASRMGDRAWRQLLDTHHERVRGLLARYRGREVDTAGDGFLATFDGPARAIRCAVAIAQAMQDLGLEVRVGLHTGEIELEGDAVRGIAVHIGTRVASLAGPGEVLVSSTVKDLVAGSGLTFEDRGEHELKGVPERWRLYRVGSESP